MRIGDKISAINGTRVATYEDCTKALLKWNQIEPSSVWVPVNSSIWVNTPEHTYVAEDTRASASNAGTDGSGQVSSSDSDDASSGSTMKTGSASPHPVHHALRHAELVSIRIYEFAGDSS